MVTLSKPESAKARAASAAVARDPMRLDRQLCFALYATSLAMTKLYQPLLASLGLTYPQYLVMLVLWEVGELSVGALGERLGLDSGTLTPLLKRLEAAGLLLRRRDAADERRVLARISPAGSALREQALRVPQHVFTATALHTTEATALAGQLQRLRASLQAATAAATLSPSVAAVPAATASHPATAKETPWPRPRRSSTPPTPPPPAAAKVRRSPTTARSKSS